MLRPIAPPRPPSALPAIPATRMTVPTLERSPMKYLPLVSVRGALLAAAHPRRLSGPAAPQPVHLLRLADADQARPVRPDGALPRLLAPPARDPERGSSVAPHRRRGRGAAPDRTLGEVTPSRTGHASSRSVRRCRPDGPLRHRDIRIYLIRYPGISRTDAALHQGLKPRPARQRARQSTRSDQAGCGAACGPGRAGPRRRGGSAAGARGQALGGAPAAPSDRRGSRQGVLR